MCNAVVHAAGLCNWMVEDQTGGRGRETEAEAETEAEGRRNGRPEPFRNHSIDPATHSRHTQSTGSPPWSWDLDGIPRGSS